MIDYRESLPPIAHAKDCQYNALSGLGPCTCDYYQREMRRIQVRNNISTYQRNKLVIELYAKELEADGFKERADELRKGIGIGDMEIRIVRAISNALDTGFVQAGPRVGDDDDIIEICAKVAEQSHAFKTATAIRKMKMMKD